MSGRRLPRFHGRTWTTHRCLIAVPVLRSKALCQKDAKVTPPRPVAGASTWDTCPPPPAPPQGLPRGSVCQEPGPFQATLWSKAHLDPGDDLEPCKRYLTCWYPPGDSGTKVPMARFLD